MKTGAVGGEVVGRNGEGGIGARLQQEWQSSQTPGRAHRRCFRDPERRVWFCFFYSAWLAVFQYDFWPHSLIQVVAAQKKSASKPISMRLAPDWHSEGMISATITPGGGLVAQV